MESDLWNPQQYERFKRERRQPFEDLLSLVQGRPQMRVVDLGCGTGELTLRVHQQLQAAHTLGIDSSGAMLASSARYGADGLVFEQQDIAAFASADRVDLLFSNAALQWLDDHPALFGRLAGMLGEGGQLAVQMPYQQDQPTHRLAHAVAIAVSPELAHSGQRPQSGMLTPEAYASLLHDLRFTEQHVRLQVYGHLLPQPAAVFDWVKGSLLTWYEQQLSPEAYRDFEAEYRRRLVEQLEDRRPYFFPFKRLLLWARR